MFIYFVPMLPSAPKTRIAPRWPIYITINPTGVHKRYKNTENAKHDRRIGSKRIKYIMFVVLLNSK